MYAADPLEGQGTVAVKIIRPEYTEEKAVVERFLEEARLSARLIHPNIVRVLEGARAEDGSPYMIMELLQGVPLGAYTQGGGRVPPAQAVPILHGILAGLAAAHAQNIVHRDLKPENVFLTREPGGAFVVKVLDFGIAKVMDAAGGMGSRTRTGMLLGTPAFMSPEQVKSARQVDTEERPWSAGVLFYEMLTGRGGLRRRDRVRAADHGADRGADARRAGRPGARPLRRVPRARAAQGPGRCGFPSALEMARALQAIAPQILAQARNRFSDLPRSSVLPRTVGSEQATQDPPRRVGGTLSSAAPSVQATEAPAQVVLLEPQGTGGTLPSRGLPMIRAGRGIAGLAVVFLVIASLAVGFLLGFAVGRAS